MTRDELEAQYDNRAMVPQWADMFARWQAASAATRAELGPTEDIAYGPAPRNRYDLFETRSRRHMKPLVVYIHGGYWQRGDRKDYSLVARPFVTAGCDVAIPSYTLCPDTTIAGITDEMRAFVVALWSRTRRRPMIVGHSAGGQLAAELLTTDWSKVAAASGAPADLVHAAYAISGVFDLAPLPETQHNVALRLDAVTARAASPRHRPAPAGHHLVAAVGANESREFIRQSLDIVDRWQAAGTRAECVLIPGANHFSVVDVLCDPASAVALRVLELAKAGSDV